jgi:hypothetical protein
MIQINKNMYNKSKYTSWYYNIIVRAQGRELDNIYTERHHIIPKSLGGSNKKDNLVKLTAREHFICHLLLPRMVNDTKSKNSMWYAAWCLLSMRGATKERVFKHTSHSFAVIRAQRAKLVSANKTGVPRSEETKRRIGAKSALKVYTAEYRKKLSLAGTGRKDSDEVCRNKSEAAKKRWEKISADKRRAHMASATTASLKTRSKK